MEKIIKNNNVPQVILRYILKEFLDIDTLVKLLYSVYSFKTILVPYRNYYVENRGFYWCCANGDIDGAKYLYECHCKEDNVGYIEKLIFLDLDNVFMVSCTGGHLELAKWLHSTGRINIKMKQNLVFRACLFDTLLDVAKWIYSLNELDFENCPQNSLEDIFGDVCENNQIETVKWLTSLKQINIHVCDDYPFLISCNRGNIEIAKWLYYIDEKCDIKSGFIDSCENGHLEIAMWLYSLGNINNINKGHRAFINSCRNGHLEVSKWLYSLGGINVHFKSNEALKISCENGHLKTAKWLHSKGASLDFLSYEVFEDSCLSGDIKMVKWLYSIEFYKFSDDLINKVYKCGHLNIVFWMYQLEIYEDVNTYFTNNFNGNKFENIKNFFSSITNFYNNFKANKYENINFLFDSYTKN